jgi:hypothetical protein
MDAVPLAVGEALIATTPRPLVNNGVSRQQQHRPALSGGRNAYHRISPRFIREFVPSFAVSRQGLLCVRELHRRDRRARVPLGIVYAPDHDNLDHLALGGRDTRHGHHAFMDLGRSTMRLHVRRITQSALPSGGRDSAPKGGTGRTPTETNGNTLFE